MKNFLQIEVKTRCLKTFKEKLLLVIKWERKSSETKYYSDN